MTSDDVERRLRGAAKRRGLRLSRNARQRPVRGVFYYVYDRDGLRVSPADGMTMAATLDWFRNTEYRVLDKEEWL
jgi:hypothetical protein